MTVKHAAMAIALLTATGAAAEPGTEGRASVVQALADCRKLADDSARLACYDKAAASLEQAEAKGDIVVVDREQARKVRRQAFGFSLPSIALFEKGEAREEVENVTGVVASARRNAAGKWTVRLEDGAVWTQVDSSEFVTDPKPGMPVRIRRASLGSFIMSVDGKRGFRAHRVE